MQSYVMGFSLMDPIPDLDSWLRKHFMYRGENREVVRTPQYMLNQLERDGFLEGDCDDISTLYASFLKALHIPVRFVAIRADSSPDFQHVFVEAWSPGWTALDPTVIQGTVYRETERMVLDV